MAQPERLVPSGDAARRRAHASSRPRSATTRPSRRSSPGRGGCRATRGTTRYAELRDEARRARPRGSAAAYRVLVDANQHVDREAAARSGVGFYGKNTMLITRRHGSWVVLGTLVTDVELESTPPLELDCGECRLCIDACPTGALDEPGDARRDEVPLVLDAGAGGDPRARTARALGAQVYGCDICQDVCPWNRGVEKRRARRRRRGRAEPVVVARRLARGRRPSARDGTTASSCRATTRAGCGGTRSSRSATPAGRRRAPCSSATRPATTSCSPSTHAWALERMPRARP